jgi:tRNA (guanine37-N1)-methyltransferase
MVKSKTALKNKDESSTSLVTATLAATKQKATAVLPPMPNDDPDYVYPVSAFPPLSTFDISVEYPALVIPARSTAELRKSLKHVLLQRAKLKVVYALSETDAVPNDTIPRDQYRKIVLNDKPDIYSQDAVLQELLDSGECCKATHDVTTSYADWTVEEVLRRILPIEEIPSAFEMIGHLAHINLRDELLPYKYLVGRAILDKNGPRVQTVVNKVGSIDTKFRTFGMEVIAGSDKEGWSRVTAKEEGCQYELDFRKVYWNSRLGGEHRRLVDVIRRDTKTNSKVVVADLMAGIGPFAVPLTSKGYRGIHVHANDLNPSSYEYLVINAKKNKCQNLSCYNLDARAFCHQLQDKGIDFQHVLMNLPATAPEFLDAFRGFAGKTLPRIHVHCFSSKDSIESERATIERCETALGCSLNVEEHQVSVHTVRNVAPNKNMYCLSFNLPEAARGLQRIEITKPNETKTEEPDLKRTKLS